MKRQIGEYMKPTTTELGAFIRARRLELRLSQVQLQKKCGVKQTSLSYLEVGERKHIDDDQLEKLAVGLECTIEKLRELMPKRPLAEPKTELCKFVRTRREELGISLEDFAKKLKMTPERIRHWETSDARYVRYGLLKLLARALKKKRKDLLRFVGVTRKEPQTQFGRLIRNRRKELGMSIADLSDELDVSTQYVNQIELGSSNLTLRDETIGKLAEILKMSPDRLEKLRPGRKLRTLVGTERSGLGEFLALKRTALRMTQQEIAALGGMSSGMVCIVEIGQHKPKASILGKFEKALNCKIPERFMPAEVRA